MHWERKVFVQTSEHLVSIWEVIFAQPTGEEEIVPFCCGLVQEYEEWLASHLR